MIGFDLKFDDNTPAVKKAVDAATFRNISHAVATIRKDAIASILPGDAPSPPGTPPHTKSTGVSKSGKPRAGKLQKAIAYDVDQAAGDGIVGPRESIIGPAGRVHEFGGELYGEEYPERAYMGPALEKNLARFGDSYAGSLGN